MNATHWFLLIFVIPIFLACSAESDRKYIVEKNKIEQPIPVKNEEAGLLAPNIGQRTAEEMVAAGFKRYGIEKGVLIFRMDGALSGTENIYFDHWGWREGKYVQTTSDIGTFDQKINKIQLLDGERRYEYDPKKNEAHYFESKQVQKSADAYGTKDMTIISDKMIKRMGGKIKGTNQIRGVKCQVWGIDQYDTEISMWKGLTMGERSAPNDIPVARTCILLDTTSVVPLEKMTLPKGAKLIKVN